MQSNLNQNMDGLKEDELDLKDNEVLLKVQQTERLELKVVVDCSIKYYGITIPDTHLSWNPIYCPAIKRDYMQNPIAFG